MKQLLSGIGFILFGVFIGGIGVATAGIGIGIPMIPIGIYLIFRGIFYSAQDKVVETSNELTEKDKKSFESTKFGRLSLGIILILVGVATSALLIGIPIGIVGVVLILSCFRK